MARSQPVQQPPPVQRLRVQYAKRGVARFASHRDFSRALERALRRAGVPMAYSSGYTPHPRISYVGAAPTGASSEAEYLELGLSEQVDPGKLAAALNAALPPGFEVVRVVEGSGRGFADRMQAAHWRIELPGVPTEALPELAALLRDVDQIEVTRMTKKGERRFDVRAAVVLLTVVDDALELILRQSAPLVRPDDVYLALTSLAPALFESAAPPRATRLGQGPLVGELVQDPLVTDTNS